MYIVDLIKYVRMKNTLTLISCLLALNIYAQETVQDKDITQPSQLQGSWYFGVGDLGSLFTLFSDEGLQVSPTISYAIIDDVVIGMGINAISYDGNGSLDFNLNARYFFGNNYFGGMQLSRSSVSFSQGSTTTTDVQNGVSFLLGKFIPFGKQFYLEPTLTYSRFDSDFIDNTGDYIKANGLGSAVGIGIKF
jgi:hypothetical protein